MRIAWKEDVWHRRPGLWLSGYGLFYWGCSMTSRELNQWCAKQDGCETCPANIAGAAECLIDLLPEPTTKESENV